jgi:hypothetical protein
MITYPFAPKQTCPKGHALERCANMFFWRGRYFSGLVCVACQALFDDPTDSFAEHIGMQKTTGPEPGKDER